MEIDVLFVNDVVRNTLLFSSTNLSHLLEKSLQVKSRSVCKIPTVMVWIEKILSVINRAYIAEQGNKSIIV